jgi:hypothetical protein
MIVRIEEALRVSRSQNKSKRRPKLFARHPRMRRETLQEIRVGRRECDANRMGTRRQRSGQRRMRSLTVWERSKQGKANRANVRSSAEDQGQEGEETVDECDMKGGAVQDVGSEFTKK